MPQTTRAKNYKYAVGSSILSKVATTASQLLLMPLAASSLGVDGFALYVMLIATAGWLSLSNLGIGPTLSIRIAQNATSGTQLQEGQLFSSALACSLALSLIVALGATAAVHLIPIDIFFGPTYAQDETTIKWALTILIIAYFIQTNVSIFEAAQAGLQQQHILNVVTALSSIPTILAIVVAAQWHPNPVSILCAGIIPTLTIRLAHAVWLAKTNSSLVPRHRSFDAGTAQNLCLNGSTYALAGTVGNFVSHVLPIMLIGRALDSTQTSAFAAVLSLIILLSGVTAMIATPAIPAIASSFANGERVWVHRAYRNLLSVGMTFSLAVTAGLYFFGQHIISIWMRGVITATPELLIAAAIYFIASTWEVIHFTVLIALRKIHTPSLLILSRSLAGAVAIFMLLPYGGVALPFAAMTIAIVLIDMIPLQRILTRTLSTAPTSS